MLRTWLIQEILVELLTALVTGILKQSVENNINKNPSATENLSKCNDSWSFLYSEKVASPIGFKNSSSHPASSENRIHKIKTDANHKSKYYYNTEFMKWSIFTLWRIYRYYTKYNFLKLIVSLMYATFTYCWATEKSEIYNNPYKN